MSIFFSKRFFALFLFLPEIILFFSMEKKKEEEKEEEEEEKEEKEEEEEEDEWKEDEEKEREKKWEEEMKWPYLRVLRDPRYIRLVNKYAPSFLSCQMIKNSGLFLFF